MSEEKKPTETEIIREQVDVARVALRELLTPNGGNYDLLAGRLLGAIAAIETANDARDKSRRLDVAFALPITETTARGLLAIGFDLALQAVVPQLKTVQKSGSCTSWKPPMNPFSTGKLESSTSEPTTTNRGTNGKTNETTSSENEAISTATGAEGACASAGTGGAIEDTHRA